MAPVGRLERGAPRAQSLQALLLDDRRPACEPEVRVRVRARARARVGVGVRVRVRVSRCACELAGEDDRDARAGLPPVGGDEGAEGEHVRDEALRAVLGRPVLVARQPPLARVVPRRLPVGWEGTRVVQVDLEAGRRARVEPVQRLVLRRVGDVLDAVQQRRVHVCSGASAGVPSSWRHTQVRRGEAGAGRLAARQRASSSKVSNGRRACRKAGAERGPRRDGATRLIESRGSC